MSGKLSKYSNVKRRLLKMSLKSILVVTINLALIPFPIFLYLLLHRYYLPAKSTSTTVYFTKIAENVEEVLESSSVVSSKLTHYLSSSLENIDFLPYNCYLDLVLELLVPESNSNFELGNFDVYTKIYNKKGYLLKSTTRPGIITYKTELLRSLQTIFSIIPLLLGYQKQSQIIAIPLVENINNDYKNKIASMRFKINNSSLHIYNAHLKSKTRYHNVSFLMHNWPKLSAILFVLLFLFISILATMYFMYKLNPAKEETRKQKRRKANSKNKVESEECALNLESLFDYDTEQQVKTGNQELKNNQSALDKAVDETLNNETEQTSYNDDSCDDSSTVVVNTNIETGRHDGAHNRKRNK